MKRALLLTIMLVGLPVISGLAQDAAAQADRDAAEERYKKLNSRVESLEEDNAVLRKKLEQMGERLAALRDEHARAAANSTVQEDLKRLAEKIQAVDKARETDMKKVAGQLEDLAKLAAGGTAPKNPGHVPTTPPGPDEEKGGTKKGAATVPTEGYKYTVQQGDYLSTILNAYNAEFKKNGMKTITQKQLVDANPGLNPNRLIPGKEIFIPKPASK